MQVSRATVLVVRANARLHVDLEPMLQARGYELAVADSAAGAVEQFLAHRPPLTLVNLPIPDARGGALARRLLELDPTATLVISGGDADVKTPADAFDLGAYEYLEEVTPTSLLATLGGALGVRRGDMQLRYLRQKDAPVAGWAGLLGD